MNLFKLNTGQNSIFLPIRIASGLIVLSLSLSSNSFAASEQDQSSKAILLQGFDWNSANGNWYVNLQSKASTIKELGVTHVWYPPPSDSTSREGYLPRQLNNLNSGYGTEAQLKSSIRSLRDLGIESIADIVINHRVGTNSQADFSFPNWGCDAVANNDEWSGRCGGDDSGKSYEAARDIDHSKPYVQNDIKVWLSQRLANVGFTGWRFDFAMGYSPNYAKLYVDASKPNFCVGEIWPDLNYDNVEGHREALIRYIRDTGDQCAAFDFTSKGLLNKALQEGDYWRLRDRLGGPAGGIGKWPQKMVTFVDNHDTGPSGSCGNGQNFWPTPCDKVMSAYAYTLTHPGIPTLYYPHVFDWGLQKNIQALTRTRRAAGITSTSPVAILKAENGLYAAIVTGTSGRVAMKIGPNPWTPGDSWILAERGDQYAVWLEKAQSVDPLSCLNKARFQLAQVQTPGTDSLYVVGNIPALGQWNPAKALPLKFQDSVWIGTVDLPNDQVLQYKYIQWNGVSPIWESDQPTVSGNREWDTTGPCNKSIFRADSNFNF